ncbi:putative adipose-regulatory protein-domain-containing protein, partial [Gamsiella multidivaricata]|uniref:putative adipose-regulatory protein-domain-containing protein n=1 Tax=Gamsiella multidivaricata TaxID=101098 RepID=UPI002220DB30
RKVIKLLVAILAVGFLVGISFCVYTVFYWIYIPQRDHVGDVYLQYSQSRTSNTIATGPKALFLRDGQAYHLSVVLTVPTSEINTGLGNFMVKVQLLNAGGNSIMSSSRSAIVKYESMAVRFLRTAWRAIPLILQWSQEAQTIKVPMITDFVEDSSNPVVQVFVEISDPRLQVYKTTLHIDAHFSGLR